MKKKGILLLFGIMLGLAACGEAVSEQKTEIVKEQTVSEETIPEEQEEIETEAPVEQVKTIQEELAEVEKKSMEHCAVDSGNMSQQEMNLHSAQWYALWDEELNSLWNRLWDEVEEERKDRLLEEQRAWVKRKEGNTVAAGVEALGGSLQPLLESENGAEMTRARAYTLAGYLAQVRAETFEISPTLQESLDKAEPTLEEVFEKFAGKWIFDEARSACVGIERTEVCDYAVEGSSWTVWITGGALFSDFDVYGYTENNLLFKLSEKEYYSISFGVDQELCLTYRASLDASAHQEYETIVCKYRLEETKEDTSGTDYSGMYTDTQGTEDVYSELFLLKQEDGRYRFLMGIYRLTTMSGWAEETGDSLHFTGYLWEEPLFEGEIVISGEGAVATFTDSQWELLASGEVFDFSDGKLEVEEISKEYLDFAKSEWEE